MSEEITWGLIFSEEDSATGVSGISPEVLGISVSSVEIS
jgi:hypothetical protein